MSCSCGHSEQIFRFDRDACSQLESGKMYAYTMGLAEDILLYDPIFTDFAVVF